MFLMISDGGERRRGEERRGMEEIYSNKY